MRISDWSSDVCSSDLAAGPGGRLAENFFHSGSFNNSFSMTSSCTAASHPPVRRANKESAGALKTISTAPYCRMRAPRYRPPSDKKKVRPFNCCQDLTSVSVRIMFIEIGSEQVRFQSHYEHHASDLLPKIQQ